MVHFHVLETDDFVDDVGVDADEHVGVCIGLEQILHI